MLLASAARRAASALALSSEATMAATTTSGTRCLSSSPAAPSTSTSAPPLRSTPSHDPQLHVQLEPVPRKEEGGSESVEGSERDSGVFALTLCRPSAKNAVGRKLLSELRGAIEALSSESPTSARALVIRSSVPGVFCAGADLRERAAMTRLEARRFVEELRATVSLLESLPFPTVAAVDGVALGGGAEIALAADVRVVGPRASFAFPETRLGIIPGAGGTHRLPRAVGLSRAKELILTCRRVPAQEALAIGLADFGVVESGTSGDSGGTERQQQEQKPPLLYSSTRLDPGAPHGAADAAALSLARSMAAAAPLAARAAKAAVVGAAASNGNGAAFEAASYFPLLSTWDRDEGLRAFAEKRAPRFRGE